MKTGILNEQANKTFDCILGLLDVEMSIKFSGFVCAFEQATDEGEKIPYLISILADMLCDESMEMSTGITDRSYRSLANMAASFYMAYEKINEVCHNISKYLGKSVVSHYEVDAANGRRVATEWEVSNYVPGMVEIESYAAGLEKDRTLKALEWAITGSDHLLTKLGYKPMRNLGYEMVVSSANDIKTICEWADSDSLEHDCEAIKRQSTFGEYRYPEHADDMVEAIPIKQVLAYVSTRVAKTSNIYKTVQSIAGQYSKHGKISLNQANLLRKIYDKDNTPQIEDMNKGNEEANVDEDTRVKCEKLRAYEVQGVIKSTEFPLKIVATLEGKGYIKASSNQDRVIKEAIQKCEKKTMDWDNKVFNQKPAKLKFGTDIEEDNEFDIGSMASMSNMLGRGMFKGRE